MKSLQAPAEITLMKLQDLFFLDFESSLKQKTLYNCFPRLCRTPHYKQTELEWPLINLYYRADIELDLTEVEFIHLNASSLCLGQ